jgi:hypothetical protein
LRGIAVVSRSAPPPITARFVTAPITVSTLDLPSTHATVSLAAPIATLNLARPIATRQSSVAPPVEPLFPQHAVVFLLPVGRVPA